MAKTSLLFLLFLLSEVHAQAPSIAWQRLYGGSSHDLFRCLALTSDNGYILAGQSHSNISGDKTEDSFNGQDYWIVKLDSSQNIEWQRTIGGATTNEILNEQDFLTVVRQTTDGGYLVGGWSNADISGNKTVPCKGADDYWIVKLSSSGAIEWQQTYGGDSIDNLFDLQQTSDGGYILAGASASSISGDKTENSRGNYDGWIIKLDAMGNISWQKTIGGSGYDGFSSVRQTVDGGYIFGASSNSSISGEKTEDSYGGNDFWILKTDALGSIEWQKTIGGDNSDVPYCLITTQDGGYLAGGYSNSPISGLKTEDFRGGIGGDFWIVKLDASGAIEWQKTLGGTGDDSVLANSLYQDTDGSYVVAGSSSSGISGDKTEPSHGGYDTWMVKLNTDGNLNWQKTIGGSGNDGTNNILKTPDGGFLLGGLSYSSNSGDVTETGNGQSDYWLLKLNPETMATATYEPFAGMVLSPNPTSGTFNIRLESAQDVTLTLTNILGQIVAQEQYQDVSAIHYNITEVTGIYFLQLRNATGAMKVMKVVKNK